MKIIGFEQKGNYGEVKVKTLLFVRNYQVELFENHSRDNINIKYVLDRKGNPKEKIKLLLTQHLIKNYRKL